MNALRLPDPDAPAHLGEALRALIRPDAGSAAPHLVSASIPIAPLDPIALYSAAVEAGEEAALLTRPADGIAFVGIGSAWSVGASGPDRFRLAETAWRALIADARLGEGPEAGSVGPVLLGGLGFSGRVPEHRRRWPAP